MNKKQLVELYKQIVDGLPEDRIPTLKDFKKYGVTRSQIRKEFDTLQKFHEKMSKSNKQVRDFLNGNTQKKKSLVAEYLKFVEKNSTLPTRNQLSDLGFNNDWVRRNFGSHTRLNSFMNEEYADAIDGMVAHEKNIFSEEKREALKQNAKNTKHRRYFITTAVSKKNVHHGFLDAVESYCEKTDTQLLLLPSMDVWNRETQNDYYEPITFNARLRDKMFVVDDLQLNDNFFICGIKVSAKQINPTTGLSRIGQRNGSYIFASPKQSLEYVATTSAKDVYPHALMTPGAITVPDYTTDLYMSERLSYIATSDHVMGGVIVEIVDDKKFHFRQVQADHDGSFIDLGTLYLPNGKVKENIEMDVVFGDWHVGHTDPVNFDFAKEVSERYNVRNYILHDFFDGDSISHYDDGKPLYRAFKFEEGRLNLREEIVSGAYDIWELYHLAKGRLIFPKSNHDERLSKYLWAGRYVNDPHNHYYCLDLAKVLLEGEVDVLEYAYRQEIKKYFNVDLGDKLKFLSRDEQFLIGDLECGQHGDLGANGARGSLNSIEKAYGRCVVGHSHSAAIQRGVYRVGTSTKLSLDYNRGPSSWTHTHAFVYQNGTVQLINVIDGDHTINK